MRRIRVPIKKVDIATPELCARSCIVYQAIRRQLPEVSGLYVGVNLWGYEGHDGCLPKRVAAFIWKAIWLSRAERRKTLKPFTFTLEIP